MKRDVTALTGREYDLVIIGGGIFGVCAAWDGALRGLSVAIIEKNDFCGATSANHFKMVHGGIRYLQHADILRIRESSRERSALLRIAPHLVKPLPIVIPTYGYGLKGKAFLAAGLLAYDMLTMDRNEKIHPEQKIPKGRFLSKDTLLNLFPGVKENNLTGGVVFWDAQVYNPPRLGLSFLRAAVDKGAVAANYIKAEAFTENKKRARITGVKAKDLLTGDAFEIRGKVVLNASGPWAHRLLSSSLGMKVKPRPVFSRDLAFVVKRPNAHGKALACTTKTQDADTILDRGGRHLFSVPWRTYTLVGVWHKVFEDVPENIAVSRRELEGFVKEVNEAYSGLSLSVEDISMINMGLTLFGDQKRQGSGNMSFGKRSILIDHYKEDGVCGLITLIGVRATTARGKAEKAIDLVFKKIGKKPVPCTTAYKPIYGGTIDSFNKLLEYVKKNELSGCDDHTAEALVRNYGEKYHEVLRYTERNPSMSENIGDSTVIKSEILHAVREEMAQKLTDVVLRRTDLGTAGHPGQEALNVCGEIMADEKGWDSQTLTSEIEGVNSVYPLLK